MNKYHFISGLSRSGSTLFSGIICQNPGFHTSMSSPVESLVNGILKQIGAGSEFYSFFDEQKRRIYVSGNIQCLLMRTKLDKEVIFDTNQMWAAKLHQLTELVEDFKMIGLVQNQAWMMDSFEQIYRKNPFNYSKMFASENRHTICSRGETMVNGGIVEAAWSALKEASYGDHSERALLSDYDLSAMHPERTLSLVYDFIGKKEFEHDFDNVEFSDDEFDYTIGVKGRHVVKRKVEYKTLRSILPPDLFKKYSDMAFWPDFWFDTAGISASVIAPKTHVLTAVS